MLTTWQLEEKAKVAEVAEAKARECEKEASVAKEKASSAETKYSRELEE